MARGRPWTKKEDRELRRIARITRDHGIHSLDPHPPGPRTAEHYLGRLRSFAKRHDRTYAAVRKRASRLGIRSYTGHGCTATRFRLEQDRRRSSANDDLLNDRSVIEKALAFAWKSRPIKG